MRAESFTDAFKFFIVIAFVLDVCVRARMMLCVRARMLRVRARMYHSTHAEGRGQCWEVSSLLPPLQTPGTSTHMVRLTQQVLYPVSHLIDPEIFVLAHDFSSGLFDPISLGCGEVNILAGKCGRGNY